MPQFLFNQFIKTIKDYLITIPGVKQISSAKFKNTLIDTDSYGKYTNGVNLIYENKTNTFFIEVYLILIQNTNFLDLSNDIQKRLQYELSKNPFFLDKEFKVDIFIESIK